MKTLIATALLAGCATSAFAKDGLQVKIQVVGTQTSTRQFTYSVPGTNATSNTHCSGSASGSTNGSYGNGTYNSNGSASGTSDCSTTSNPGTAPTTRTGSIAQDNVHAILPGGRHVDLWCQNGFRKCVALQPGYYDAEIKGDVIWVSAYKLDHSVEKVKYHAVDSSWSESVSTPVTDTRTLTVVAINSDTNIINFRETYSPDANSSTVSRALRITTRCADPVCSVKVGDSEQRNGVPRGTNTFLHEGQVAFSLNGQEFHFTVIDKELER
jgi:hypothetical protein